jgi:hypothetical protein
VYNEAEQEWYWCSDGEVSQLSDRPRKRMRVVDVDDETVTPLKDKTSKDAYMLVYKRATANNIEPRSAPETIYQSILADNVALHAEVADRECSRVALSEEFDNISATKKDVLATLPGVSWAVGPVSSELTTDGLHRPHRGAYGLAQIT